MTKNKQEAKTPEIDSEQVFDILPIVVDIYDKIDFDTYRKKLQNKYSQKKKTDKKLDYVDPSVDAIKFLLKNSPKYKEEFFKIVAIAERSTVEEVKKQPFSQLINTVKNIFGNTEISDFLKEAMQ